MQWLIGCHFSGDVGVMQSYISSLKTKSISQMGLVGLSCNPHDIFKQTNKNIVPHFKYAHSLVLQKLEGSSKRTFRCKASAPVSKNVLVGNGRFSSPDIKSKESEE